jgi:hypothetical protein
MDKELQSELNFFRAKADEATLNRTRRLNYYESEKCYGKENKQELLYSRI